MLRHAAMLAPLAVGDVLHGAEHAKEPARLVPDHIALTTHEAHLAVGPGNAIFDVVAPATPKRLRHGCRPRLTGCRVEQLLDVVKRQDAFLRPQAQDAVLLVRPRVAVRRELALPVADVGDPLGLFESALAFA